MKIAMQLDFDGTITEEDVSFLLLDTYVGPKWREYHKEYSSGKIPVGVFNKKVFGMMQADRQTMTNLVLTSDKVKIRPGFRELIDYCRKKEYKIVVISNGLTFYIEAILEKIGIDGITIHAAENTFFPGGMSVRYVAPDGNETEIGFKEAWTEALKTEGYDVIYAGNGTSDIYPARMARHVFATQDLLRKCQLENLPHIPFNDFHEVMAVLKSLDIG